MLEPRATPEMSDRRCCWVKGEGDLVLMNFDGAVCMGIESPTYWRLGLRSAGVCGNPGCAYGHSDHDELEQQDSGMGSSAVPTGSKFLEVAGMILRAVGGNEARSKSLGALYASRCEAVTGCDGHWDPQDAVVLPVWAVTEQYVMLRSGTSPALFTIGTPLCCMKVACKFHVWTIT